MVWNIWSAIALMKTKAQRTGLELFGRVQNTEDASEGFLGMEPQYFQTVL